ncbi:MAG: hypothetical protein ACP5G1_02300 [Nanopusillaceae archaeon]
MAGIFDLAKLLAGRSPLKDIPKENLEYSKNLVEEAKKNLEKSENSFKDKNYSDSIYYLEQSLYKSVMAMTLLFSMLKLKDVKDKKYSSFEEFLEKNKMFDKMKKLVDQNSKIFELLLSEENKKKFKEDYEEYKKSVDNFLKKLKDKNYRKEIVRYDENKLNELLNINEKITKYQLSDEILESYINIAMAFLSKFGGNRLNSANMGMVKSLIKKELIKNKDNLNIFGNILILSAILMLYEKASSGEDKDLELSKKDFNENMGIIKLYNKINAIVGNLIRFEENFIQIMENKNNVNLF